MVDRRKKDVHWPVAGPDGETYSWESACCAVLMDIRDELKSLNALLHCANFQAIPRTLRGIHRKLPTRRKKK